MTKTSLKRIHLVIYSTLEKYGGGRETWADYFLKSLNDTQKFESINIYCLGSENYSNTLIETFKNNDKVKFFPTRGRLTRYGFLRTLTYIYDVLENIKSNSDNGEVVLFLGAIIEGITAIVIKIRFKSQLKTILWVRSIGLKELSTRKNMIILALLKYVEKWAFKISNAIIFNGKDTFDYYKEIYINEIKKMFVIENAVDYKLFSKIGPITLIDNSINVAYIGRFNKEKGFFDFLDSINVFNSRNCRNTGIKINFQIWGFGMKFEVPKNTTYHGILEREDIIKVLEKNQVIVFLNLSEAKLAGGLSHGILEALASGRLCLAYNNPAHNQILNQNNSILVQEGNIQDLASVYSEIVSNVSEYTFDFYKNRIIAGQINVRKYSIEEHFNKFLDVYYWVIEK